MIYGDRQDLKFDEIAGHELAGGIIEDLHRLLCLGCLPSRSSNEDTGVNEGPNHGRLCSFASSRSDLSRDLVPVQQRKA